MRVFPEVDAAEWFSLRTAQEKLLTGQVEFFDSPCRACRSGSGKVLLFFFGLKGKHMSKVWFITGAGRGMGGDIAKAALAAGHAVVASGRDRDAVSKALGQSKSLLTVTLDVTKPADAEAAVKATIARFGRIDVLVNNAASFYAGYFEELINSK